MALPIHQVPAVGSTQALPAIDTGAAKKSDGFSQLFTQMLGDVNQSHQTVDQSIDQLVKGESDNVHEVVLSMAKADLAFRLMLEIRNRLTESYQEILRMQI